MSTPEDIVAPADAAPAQAAQASAPGLENDVREPLPRAVASDRLLWTGAVIAVLAHILPFVYLGQPKPLGDDVLTEAIAVELVDKAVLEGKDHTPATPPSAASPPPQPAAQPAPPGPPQKPKQAIPPSPPPAPPQAKREPEPPKPDAAAAPKPSLPAFEGDGPDAKPQVEPPKTAPDEAKRVDPKETAKPAAKVEPPQKQPRPPQPQRPPPQQAVAPQAPPAQPSAKAAPARPASMPGLAKSGEVSKFAKEVVAALAKAKPNAPGIKGSVTVTVVVAFGGGVRTAKITGPSGRDDLDKLALEAAKAAKLPPPPPDVTTDDLFYDVEYKFQ